MGYDDATGLQAVQLNQGNTHGIRVSLVYPPFDDKRDRSAYYLAPPLGLLYIASYLEEKGFTVTIHDQIFELKTGNLIADLTLYEQCANRILAANPHVICFSTQCTTSPGAINIARIVKRTCPEVITVLGGHDVSFIAERYLSTFEEIDFVLAGEAELTLPRLIASIRDRSDVTNIPGLFWRDRTLGVQQSTAAVMRVKELDSLLPPALHLVSPLERYFEFSGRPTILVDSGRGCAFNCEFCQTTLLNGSKIRYRSVPSLIEELSNYKRLYGVYEAYFVHDLFTARRSFVEELCDALIAASLGITWQCRCRLDQIDRLLLDKMARAGCRMLLYGIESGSPETLKRMNKRSKVSAPAAVVERVSWTVESGIFPSLSMVIGTPEETREDLNATMELAYNFLQLGSVNAFIQLMSPLPGTTLAARLESRFSYHGNNSPSAFSQGIEFNSGCRLPEDEEVIKAHPLIFESFQAVVPDHGDLQLCVDISLTYCKLLEIYRRTFGRLTALRKQTHLDVFVAWRTHWLTEIHASSLVGSRDYDIWSAFERFVERECRAELDHDGAFRAGYYFEKVLRAVSESPPVVPHPSRLPETFSLQLADGARFFQSNEQIEGFSPAKMAVLFASPDRLHVLPLSESQRELIDTAIDQNVWRCLSATTKERIIGALQPLVESGVLVPQRETRLTIKTAVAQQVA